MILELREHKEFIDNMGQILQVLGISVVSWEGGLAGVVTYDLK